MARILRLLIALVVVSGLTGVLGTALVIPVVASAGWAVNTGATYFDSLPSDLVQAPLPVRSVLLAKNGQPITYFFDENRVNVPIQAVAPVLQEAVVAIEDARFYEHG